MISRFTASSPTLQQGRPNKRSKISPRGLKVNVREVPRDSSTRHRRSHCHISEYAFNTSNSLSSRILSYLRIFKLKKVSSEGILTRVTQWGSVTRPLLKKRNDEILNFWYYFRSKTRYFVSTLNDIRPKMQTQTLYILKIGKLNKAYV